MQDYGVVSIIMPSWNCGQYVEETIQSVSRQTYQNWELLFQDDCSTDDTREIVESLALKDERIKYECNSKNSGAAITRNKALQRAKGRWIAFLDSDDLWYPQKLEKQLEFMRVNGYKFTCHYSEDISEKGKKLNILTKSPKHISKFMMHNYCFVGCLTVMYDANYIGLVQIADIKKNNDYAIWLEVIKKADCFCLSQCLASYRVRSGSISRHSKLSLIKWHYRLWHDAEGQNPIIATVNTFRNMIFGVYKKVCLLEKM